MWLFLKHYLKLIIYNIFDLTVLIISKLFNTQLKKNIAIIKTDNIGDYVLFRNFLKEIKQNKDFSKKKIILIGNYNYKNIAVHFDKKYVDKFVWVDKEKFLKNLFYRFSKLLELKKYKFNYLLNPIYSRDFFISDWISRWIIADCKIGYDGDLSCQKKYQKNISDTWYDELLKLKKNVKFEFHINKFFFERFLKTKLKIKKTFFDHGYNLSKKGIKKYICLFVDAGNKKRIYSEKKFEKIANYFLHNTKYKVLILGQKRTIFKVIKNKNLLDLTNRISLVKIVEIIRNSELIISNDTFAHHVAAAVNSNCIVLHAGFFHQRFVPYPKNFRKHKTLMSSKKKRSKIYKNLEQDKFFNQFEIDNIKPIQVIDLSKKILKLN